MRITQNRAWLLGTVALAALGTASSAAMAGGFDVREQSAFFQGTSFAGAAAGGSSLSSIFWNPAAGTFVGSGITTDSNYSLVLPNVDVTATGVGAPGVFAAGTAGLDKSVDIGRDALVPASYAAWRYNDRTVFTVSMNSQFGLTTKPDNINWAGSIHAQTSKIFSLNITPGVAYEIMPGVSVGAGLQVQYFELKKYQSRVAELSDAEDIGIGGTAGINITPFRGSSVGLGYRSRIEHDIDGSIKPGPLGVGVPTGPATATLDTPDKVTLSLRQELNASARLMATVEWTNWSLFNDPVKINIPGGQTTLPFGWEDGWLYSIGGEYDFSPKLTLRAGVGYEESPIQKDTARLAQLPDNDRVWASVGATYNYSDTTKINVAYSHVFVEDGSLQRERFGNAPPVLFADAESSVDVISVGLTMKMDNLFGHSLTRETLK